MSENAAWSGADPDPIAARQAFSIPMRDGVNLAADVYRPREPGASPTVVSITPYGREVLRDEARRFARNGYSYVAVDARGRFGSEGESDAFQGAHRADGYDVVEWCAAQPWSTGKVGMTGVSAGGWSTWWTASTSPPHLAAIVPIAAPGDAFTNVPYQDGVLTGGWFPDWAVGVAGRTAPTFDPGRPGDSREQRLFAPYAEINTRPGVAGDRLREWLHRTTTADQYWDAIAYQSRYDAVDVPSLSVTGWFDLVYSGTPMNYLGMKAHGGTPEARRPMMVIGPWNHGTNRPDVVGADFGPDAIVDLEGLVLRWFDRFLKGVDNGIDQEPPVRIFVMGENAWHAEDDWPPPGAAPTPFYLDAVGGLVREPGAEGRDAYRYDPHDPTPDPYAGHPDSSGVLDGPLDTGPGMRRGDVLVYRTAPLETAVEVIGPIEAVLYASTSARDTDWFVRLTDVHPDGRSILLAEGALRARNRDPENDGRFTGARLSVVRPGKTYRYTVRFWRDTANLFAAGHRIGIEISSSWFPAFLPNLNTGADNVATVHLEDAVVADQVIYRGARHPSHVVLHVVDRRGEKRSPAE